MDAARTESHDVTGQFGALLKQLRSRAGLTQEALAEQARLGVRTVRGLETGERGDPRVATVRQLADALGLEAADRVALFAAAGHARGVAPTAAGQARKAIDDRLVEAAGRLAFAVHARWQREEEQRKVRDPLPLPVRWRPVPADLTDSWANIRRVPAGGGAPPLDLTGQLDQVVDVYRRIPSGRLVVLGSAGSGKTILTLRFVLDVLGNRAPTDPVPVIFGIGPWQPTTTALRDWLTAQLLRDHPDLAAPGPDGATLAAALVETNAILPVLDGFDEIAAGLHRAALEALNATTLPLLLTSRAGEYSDAVAATDVLTAAAGVELTDLTTDDLAGYLPRTTRRTGAGGSAWQPVLTQLRDDPDSAASATLSAVLATPLMVVLARTVYSDTPDHDPAELLDTGRFPTRESLADHLLANFVPTVYRDRTGREDWDVARVQRWLGYLAGHLTRLGTHDLAWWQLGLAMSRATRVLVVGLAVGLTVGLADLVVEGILLQGVSPFLAVFSTVLGVVAGAAFALGYHLLARPGRAAFEPARVRLRFRGRTPRRVRGRVRVGLVGGFLLGFGYGLVREVLRGLLLDLGQGPLVGIIDAVLFGLVFAVGAALMFGLVAAFEAPLDLRSAASPAGLLLANRRTVFTQVLLFAPVLAVVVPLLGWLVVLALQASRIGAGFGVTFSWSPLFALGVALITGLGGGVAYVLSLTAWGHWVVFGRVWLPLTGRLPWALPAFLDDAYRRGVLRRAGAVYQFRHARLEDHFSRVR